MHVIIILITAPGIIIELIILYSIIIATCACNKIITFYVQICNVQTISKFGLGIIIIIELSSMDIIIILHDMYLLLSVYCYQFSTVWHGLDYSCSQFSTVWHGLGCSCIVSLARFGTVLTAAGGR